MTKKIVKHIPEQLKNKWILSTLILFVWLLFFEEISIVSLIKTKFKISTLKNEWKFKENKIKAAKEKKALIIKDVEKYARETFWMKKDNEELFIVLENKK